MNPTRRTITVLVFLVATFQGLAAETVIDQLYGLRSYELADAYWAAGQKFADLGQTDRAAQFKAKAKRLFPGYVPGQAPAFDAVPVSAPARAAPTLPETSVVREQNLQGQKMARLQFQKLLRGYLTGSAGTVASVLGTNLVIQGQSVVPTAEAIKTYLEAHPTDAGQPEDLFRTESIEITDGAGQQVMVTVASNPSAQVEAQLAFWAPRQVYTFDRAGDTWKLISIEGR